MSMNLIPGIESTGDYLSAEKIRLKLLHRTLQTPTPPKMLQGMSTKERSSF